MGGTKTDLVVRKDAPLDAEELLGAISSAAGEGLENISSNEIVLPRLAIIQPTSPMVTDGDARPGDIANLVTGEVFGQKALVYPLLFWSSRLKWSSTELNSRIECSAKDGRNGSQKGPEYGHGVCSQCPFSQWNGDTGPLCTEFKNILMLVLPEGADPAALLDTAPCVYAAKRMAVKPTNQFLSAAAALRLRGNRVPLFASSYYLTTERTQNDKGTFFLPVFSRIGYVNSVETFNYLRSVYQDAATAQNRFAVDQSGEYQDEGVAENSEAEIAF